MYRQYFTSAGLFILMLIFPGSALADMYVGAGVGNTRITNSSGVTVSDTATHVFARLEWLRTGGRVPYNVGIEISAVDFGDFNGTKLSGETIKWIITQTYGNRFAIFAGIGTIKWHADYPGAIQDDDGSNFSSTLGIRLHIMKHLSLRLQGEYHQSVARIVTGDKDDDLMVWSGGVNYRY